MIEDMKKLKLYLERCSGCKRCELECVAEHSDSKSYVGAVLSQHEPITRIFVESFSEKPVPLVCRHCKDALCVSACMAGCMQKNPETGIVGNMGHEQKCVGCWMCIMACPYGVINPSFNGADNSGNGQGFDTAIKCDLCPGRNNPACADGCPNKVIEVVNIQENSM
ncbi:MAG: 4Fe-4S dicluster domain-containing protein [Actinobacteria bacterium]|nr:4Fe-4S dicluster domain-containing protein [Actinomycetota bacterium]